MAGVSRNKDSIKRKLVFATYWIKHQIWWNLANLCAFEDVKIARDYISWFDSITVTPTYLELFCTLQLISIAYWRSRYLIIFWWWIRNGLNISEYYSMFSLASIFCISASTRSNKLASLKLLLDGIDPYQATNVWLPKNSFFFSSCCSPTFSPYLLKPLYIHWAVYLRKQSKS